MTGKQVISIDFPTDFEQILDRIATINPVDYGCTRNYIDGAVTYLSPYISRGVISTKLVYQTMLKRGFSPKKIEKFIQELAWRDYWQEVWIFKGAKINQDLKHVQKPIANHQISTAIIEAKTGIDAIDQSIVAFYKTRYLHNHLRMYIASIACNIAQNHWLNPAKWMYYHLLDADWASNALSWQWVAGTNSHKKYYANQENINKFCYSNQKVSFLDVSYDDFDDLAIPEILIESQNFELQTPLPEQKTIVINNSLPTLIYNFYNIDPLWKNQLKANRVFLLEPSHFKNYPVAKKTIDFMIALSKNIDDVQVYVGEFRELVATYQLDSVYYKEHPLNNHYQGIEESRDWLFQTNAEHRSFFSFWKKCKKEIIFE